MAITNTLLFIFFSFSCCFSAEHKFLVNQPVLTLYEECSEESSYDSQTIYGHTVLLIEKLENGWAKVEMDDGYQGYALTKGLIPDQPRWRTSERICQISSIAGMVYPIADTEKPALLRLPYGAYVELEQDYDSNQERWLRVNLCDGRKGWIQRGDVEKFKLKTLDEVIELSHKFKELPYIWGGTSSEGFDCSGYMQTLFKQMGILLPRNSRQQVASSLLAELDAPEKVGDLLFFGTTRVNHVGIYLGEGRFIHSGVRNHTPRIAVTDVSTHPLLHTKRIKEVAYHSSISPITDEIKARMTHSWRNDNPVPLADLRYLRLSYWGFDGCAHEGELIVHKEVAQEVVDIFGDLFAQRYPIEKMVLIDAYEADDDRSCEDNNTSSFCSRPITGGTAWSLHSLGTAIDLNPLLNPYYNKAFRTEGVIGQEFLNRSLDCRGIIRKDDACYRAFISRGWQWGGNWQESRGYVDYQHFYKE